MEVTRSGHYKKHKIEPTVVAYKATQVKNLNARSNAPFIGTLGHAQPHLYNTNPGEKTCEWKSHELKYAPNFNIFFAYSDILHENR